MDTDGGDRSMSSNHDAVPQGFSTVTPYLIVDDAAAAIDFYTAAFGATETFRLKMEGGRIAHAEIRIGASPIMLGETSPDWTFMKSPTDLGGAAVHLYLYLPDADTLFQRALQNGAEVVMPMEVHSDGDRRGGVLDPFGFLWWIATATEPGARERLLEEQKAAG
jgi:PhnB protein